MVLSVGHRVPTFTLPDSQGSTRSLEDFLKGGPVVMAFFPFAFSGTCDKEMCSFRDSSTDLEVVGGRVVGISVDSVFTLRAFGRTYGLEFPLLSDFNRRVARLYGVLEEKWVSLDYRGVARRAVFIVNRRGILIHRWMAMNPSDEPPYPEIFKAVEEAGR